ncbi:hypothetical protein F5B21DRAFT_470386 [Xylaria acuta]|nr:hypothetical protein F5B21DRAFT_470386 [Xylaria acuta]
MSASNEPRTITTADGEKVGKNEYVESNYEIGRYDHFHMELLILNLQDIVDGVHEPQVPNLEKARERLLADGKISTRQSDLIKSVSEKIRGMAGAAARLLIAIHLLPPNALLDENLNGRAIFLLERYDRQVATVDWIEYWAEKEPDNVAELINDAIEFPDPPFQL